MYPARKEADALYSGTGVFYQAMPAVGADGKNIMKLIPVQMVNGKFVQSQMSKPKTAPKPQKATSIRVASAPVHMGKTAAAQHIVREQGSFMNASPRQVGGTDQCSDLCNSLNKYPLQQQTLNLTSDCEKSVRLPVTVKSPALPRGQYLQIPSNAQVRTVPVSQLPPGLKKQIFTSSASSSSGLPSVVYVSPVMTVNQSNSVPERLSETSNMTSPSSGRFKPHLKLIPKVSQRPNSPIKWVIEEEEESFRTATIDPLVSPCVTSEILQAVAGREVTNHEITTKETPVSPSSLAKIEKGHHDALVMCNGKVFFVAKKCKQALKLRRREADPPTAAPKSYYVKKTRIPPSQNSLGQDSRIIIPDESDEVIDLCNDDCPDDSSQQAAPACTSTHLDEDNVIFVSYIPPKSEPTQDMIQKAVKERKETEQTDARSSDSVTEQQSLDGATSSASESLIGSSPLRDHLASHGRVGSYFLKGGKAGQLVSRASNTNRQDSASSRQMKSMEVDLETESLADASTSDSSREICSQTEDAYKMESSEPPTNGTFSPAPKPCRVADHLLRQIFGITAVVKISLQRIDEVSALENKSINKQSVEDVQETNGLKEKKLYLQDLYNPQETESDSKSLLNVKRVNLPTEQEPVTPDLYTDIRPIKCSLYKQTVMLKSKHPSGQSSHKGILCDVETEPVIGYVEPIDDDLPSADENDIPNSQAQTCVSPNSNTRRMGRPRKRTMCPCCIPGALDPAVKSGARLEEAERWDWNTEQTSKKGGRTSTKTRRKDGKRPGSNNCVTAKNKQSCRAYEVPASGSLSATSMDSDELKQHGRIKRLKELLKEKEATLEMMRNGMISD